MLGLYSYPRPYPGNDAIVMIIDMTAINIIMVANTRGVHKIKNSIIIVSFILTVGQDHTIY